MSDAVSPPADASTLPVLRQWDAAAPLHLLAMDTGTSELTIAVGEWAAGCAIAGEPPALQQYAEPETPKVTGKPRRKPMEP